MNGTDSAVEINENGIKIPSGTVLDLGSVGKGIACDEVRGVLEKAKIKRAVVSVGGSILLYGDGEKFTVGIRDPFSESSAESFARLTLPACCVSTSGSYERYFERGGVHYHHILDPKTGYPAESGLVSVTVVCDDGFCPTRFQRRASCSDMKNRCPCSKNTAPARCLYSTIRASESQAPLRTALSSKRTASNFYNGGDRCSADS